MRPESSTPHRPYGSLDIAATAATFLLALQTVLVVLALSGAVLPRWGAVAVESGSMHPAIQIGDVVLVEEGAVPRVDDVVLVERPGQPPLLHRVVDWTDDGRALTQGDANADRDSTPVALEQMVGVGRVVLPSVGLPHAWIQGRRFGALALLAAANAALVATIVAWVHRRSPPTRVAHGLTPLSAPQLASLREMAGWRVAGRG